MGAKNLIYIWKTRGKYIKAYYYQWDFLSSQLAYSFKTQILKMHRPSWNQILFESQWSLAFAPEPNPSTSAAHSARCFPLDSISVATCTLILTFLRLGILQSLIGAAIGNVQAVPELQLLKPLNTNFYMMHLIQPGWVTCPFHPFGSFTLSWSTVRGQGLHYFASSGLGTISSQLHKIFFFTHRVACSESQKILDVF